ncbi:MAG: Urease accessory protein UreE [Verrucomicrobiota bacterium]|jgi:urease accessory protein
MTIVNASLAASDVSLPEIRLTTDRLTLAKRLWRGAAEDGTEFGFELSAPLRHGDTFFQTATTRYAIAQQPEPVVEISLAVAPSAAAGIGWAVGNLHLELQAEPARLLAPDEPAVRQLLVRLNVPFTTTTVIFRPGRFARGQQPTHDLGPSHKH